jgi:hypothetical protein
MSREIRFSINPLGLSKAGRIRIINGEEMYVHNPLAGHDGNSV